MGDNSYKHIQNKNHELICYNSKLMENKVFPQATEAADFSTRHLHLQHTVERYTIKPHSQNVFKS